MRLNVIRGWLGVVHGQLVRLEESLWFRYVLKPAVLGVPPLLITAFYSNKAFSQYCSVNVPTLARFLTDEAAWALVFAAVYPGVIVALTQSLTRKVQPKGPNVESLLTLLAALDGVVGAKLNRFANYFRQRTTLTKENAF
jgi:hypothetical protein